MTMRIKKLHARAIAVAVMSSVLLGGCAAQAPSLAYQGPAQAGALSGHVVCATITLQHADFAQFPVSKDHPGHNGDYVMQPEELDGVYGDEIVSAVRQEGATITTDCSKADLLIQTTMRPAVGHKRLVWTQYQLAKSAALALVPLTHSRYYIQHDQIDEHVSVTFKGQAPKTVDIALSQVVPYKSTTLVTGAQSMDDMKVYRDQQSLAIQKVLAALRNP